MSDDRAPYVQDHYFRYRCPACGWKLEIYLGPDTRVSQVSKEDRCGICKRDIMIEAGCPRILKP